MIKPSLIRPFVEYFTEDPAFIQAPKPPAAPAADADEAARAAHDEAQTAFETAAAEYATKLTTAWQTGNWSALRVDGAGEPTGFQVRLLGSELVGKLIDLQRAGVGENELLALAFRAALTGVTNLGNAQVSFTEDPRLGRIATLSFFEDANITGTLGVRICREIGGRVLRRASDLSPT